MNPTPLLVLAIALLGGGCAPRPVEPPPPSEYEARRLEGTVSVVGSAPLNVRVVFQPEGAGGGGYRLEGPLAEEVRHLAGFRLTVEGFPGEAPPPEGRSLHVERYEIHSPWGTPLTVGEVSSAEGERVVVREEGGTDVLLLLPEGAVQPGQKVWVEPVDPSAPEPRRVLRYGVLRR